MAKKEKTVTKTVTTVTTVTTEPTNEKTQIVCILDRSGSMSGIMSDSIGGFNTFLKQQRELPDEATLTVALFDDKYELLYDNVDIKKVKDITDKEWYPRGVTGLYDAIGKTINNVKASHKKLGVEAPAKVLVCIVTDGHENASKEYRLEDVKKLIKDCENDDWNFMYLAANQDAFAVGSSFGVSSGNTYNYAATMDGVSNMSATLTSATLSYRGMNSNDDDFKLMSKSLIDDKKDSPEDSLDGNFTLGDNITLGDTTGTNTTTGGDTIVEK